MAMRITTATLTLASLPVLAALACGGDDETPSPGSPSSPPSVLVDLDPESTGMTVTIENITADADGLLYTSDRESGNVLRIDPESPEPVVVGRLESRTDAAGMPLRANGAGLAVTPDEDLLIASGAFNEVLRLTAAELRGEPAAAQTFVTGVMGANALLLEGDRLFVSGGATGNVYLAPASGGAAEIWASIAPNTRAVPPDDFMQSVVSNGMARAESGALLVADTSRAAVWTIPENDDGSAGEPEIMVQDAALEGVDGLAIDSSGRLWAAVNERNALVTIEDGEVRDVYKNGNTGPLEFPAALVFVGNTGYVANFDRARADNFAADGTTSSGGIGSSIIEFALPRPSGGSTSDSPTGY
jgi:sugar lactone lactonase YvrE